MPLIEHPPMKIFCVHRWFSAHLTSRWTATGCEMHDRKYHSAYAQMAWSPRFRSQKYRLTPEVLFWRFALWPIR